MAAAPTHPIEVAPSRQWLAPPATGWERTVVAVVDQVRATTTAATALEIGVRCVLPVDDPDEARALRRADPNVLLAGEREAKRLAGFDFGNSPSELLAARARLVGRQLALATTNGTRALAAVPPAAAALYAFALVNVSATAAAVARWLSAGQADGVLIVCSGTNQRLAVDDLLAAGTLLERLAGYNCTPADDTAWTALAVYAHWRGRELDCLRASRAGRNVRAEAQEEDLAICAAVDRFGAAALRRGRELVRAPAGAAPDTGGAAVPATGTAGTPATGVAAAAGTPSSPTAARRGTAR